MLLMIWVAVLLVSLMWYLRDVHSRVSARQVRHLPALPIVGHMARVLLKQEHLTKTLQRTYEAFPEDTIVGHYEFVNHLFLVRDPELLKRIMVKDFEHFVDRRAFATDNDPILSRSLLLLKGDEWKAMRSTLSPAFTGSKMKLMIPFMVEATEKMIAHIKKKIENSAEGYIDADIKDLTCRCTSDVIASCAFGLEINSTTTDNEFFIKTKDITTFNLRRMLMFIGFRSLPWLMKLLKVTYFPIELENYLIKVVMETMRQRETRKIIRHDMIHLLMEAKKGKLLHDTNTVDTAAGFATIEESAIGKRKTKTEWSDSDLVSQAVVFLFAGFETNSTTISFLLHAVASNPDIQNKLVNEIEENESQNGGKIEYEAIQKMAYLDMVVCEALRMWPAAPMIDRSCVKTYNAGRPNKAATKDFVVQKGEALSIPLWPIHYDPQYFPDPEKFDPERFSEENRHKIKPFTYIPFGLGPRGCIGSRFGLCNVKIMAYYFLRDLEVSLCARSCVPAALPRGSAAMSMAGGHWLRVRARRH